MPPAVAGELVRRRLIERLDGRWDVPVTTVVGGPGFGKSIALAQAIRANHANPKGIDAWVSCEPGDEDAEQLAGAMLRAIGAPYAGPDATTAVLNGLRHTSPVPVCLVIDDVHELPDRSSAMAMIGDIVRRLPAHAHVVVAGRGPTPLPLARLRAADRVLDIDQYDLAFTADEVDTLARAAHHDATRLGPLAGWPALVRLTLAAPTVAPSRFVWEEVVAGLAGADRRALLALSILGTADGATLSHLCGATVDIEHMARTIPLVVDTGDGRVRAHDLWHNTLAALMPADEVRSMGRSALDQLLASDAHVAAGSLAVRLGDYDALGRAALLLVRNTPSALPVDTAAAWLQATPGLERRRPELVLLAAAVAHAMCDTDPAVDERLDEALEGFRRRAAAGDAGATHAQHVALGLRLVILHTRGDLLGVAGLFEEIKRLPLADHDPLLAVLPRAVEATEAHLLGDMDRAAAILGAIRRDRLPATIVESLQRLRWHALVLAGRADEATIVAAEHLACAPTPNARLFASVARWLAGDPTGFDGAEPEGLAALESTATMPYPRDWFNNGVFTAMVWASSGDLAVVDRALDVITALDLDLESSRCAAPLAVTRAVRAIVDHDDELAARVIADQIERHPLTDRFADVYLRRFPAVPYVCSVEARRRWDAEQLGPAHAVQRDVARALLAAREGRLRPTTPIPAAPAIFTALPLPWSVELACRAHAVGHRAGVRLAQWLVDRLGTPVSDELRRRAAAPGASPGPDGCAAARGAAALLRLVPFPPELTTRLELIGPLRLLVDGRPVDRPERRRARVRELLALLVVFGSVSRERAMDLLWYELAPADAARNLRVTLTHLRRWLEPERSRGEAGFHVRVEGEQICLAVSPRLAVDAWELQDHLQAAAAARRRGDVAGQVERLERALTLWRGDPLTDLDRLPEVTTEAEHLRVRLADAALELGELRLAGGDTAGTLACAERVLAASPFAERALRLLLAAHLQRGDLLQIRSASRRAVEALDDLGLPPQPETEILLRQAGELTRSLEPAVAL